MELHDDCAKQSFGSNKCTESDMPNRRRVASAAGHTQFKAKQHDFRDELDTVALLARITQL